MITTMSDRVKGNPTDKALASRLQRLQEDLSAAIDVERLLSDSLYNAKKGAAWRASRDFGAPSNPSER